MSTKQPNEPFPVAAAQLLGNFCQTLLYGVYLVTCAFCARTLLWKGSGQEERWVRPSEIRWLMAVVAMTFFALSTFDVAIGLLHNVQAFIRSTDSEAAFHNIGEWINIARTVDQVVIGIIADFVLLYRCWIVYARRWLVITPSLVLYLGGIATAIKLIQVEASPKTDRGITLASNSTVPWNSSFFALAAAQNILTSGILIWRLWRVERSVQRYGSQPNYHQPRHLRQVIRVIAESGAAYTMTVFFAFVASVSHSNAIYPVSDTALQAAGIAFNVILVRSSVKRDQWFATFDHTGRQPSISTWRGGGMNIGTTSSRGPAPATTDKISPDDEFHRKTITGNPVRRSMAINFNLSEA
ncbi:hypothetical protein NP233_g10572 [Leucocoprinus birnbaumii]|uniref:Uncharacterized protein n=1 Tax=Leucocoprinus birnbaumii TaxID=56174 RepID=A0AAD5VJ03_9AGAR|nr:hypothetical protein NP233_g10572 [Leucocoprinus birnbaumii]